MTYKTLFTVYQINLSDDEYKAHRETYLNTTHRPTADSIIAARDLYKPVAHIWAESLNRVFDIGNIGPQKYIERLAPMQSISVGDVIVNENDEAYFVAPFGFEKVNFNLVAN